MTYKKFLLTTLAALVLSMLSWLLFFRALDILNPETNFTISQNTKDNCLYGANLAKQGFVGTEFEDWNFYESCLLNVICTNQTRSCPVQEIHEQAAFFVVD